jgi:hypothetical protein
MYIWVFPKAIGEKPDDITVMVPVVTEKGQHAEISQKNKQFFQRHSDRFRLISAQTYRKRPSNFVMTREDVSQVRHRVVPSVCQPKDLLMVWLPAGELRGELFNKNSNSIRKFI